MTTISGITTTMSGITGGAKCHFDYYAPLEACGLPCHASPMLSQRIALHYVVFAGATITWLLVTPAAASVFRCINPVSGAGWTINVDFAHATVDSYAANITRRWITWHNTADQGFYSLDRLSGDLTIRRASSTGGYEQHASCRPD